MAADVGVEAAIAVSDDVESRDFLVAQICRDRIQILLAVVAVHHRLTEAAPAEIFRVPQRPGQRADDGGREYDSRRCAVHIPPMHQTRAEAPVA